jgi:DMSO/TMAO reductase YedYZ molybdopterin-dependent catalytic subunit
MNVGDPESKYYESIGMDEALHPQTILDDMNDKALDIPHGAPLRLRVERQLGYKMAKYIMRIEAVESFASFRGARAAIGKTLAMPGTRESSPRLAASTLSIPALLLEITGRAGPNGRRQRPSNPAATVS